jgi:acyl-CoA synthetase (NDP forming)
MARDMQAWLVAAAREHGVQLPEPALLELLEPDIQLNTQGLEVWLQRLEKVGA